MEEIFIKQIFLPTSSGPCSSPTLSLGCFSSKGHCWTPGPSPPPLSPNQSSSFGPTSLKPTLHYHPTKYKATRAATPLWTLITLPQHHQTLPDPRDRPLARYQRGRGETLALLCKEEEKNDAILDPFGSPSLHRFNPLRHSHLTLHSILIQEHGSLDPH
jgi:hypothetical protein